MTVMISLVAALIGGLVWAVRDEHREREAVLVAVRVEESREDGLSQRHHNAA